MAKSRTTKLSGPPILGGLFGVKRGYKTTISAGGQSRSGAGKTPHESQQRAKKKWSSK
jgi:hypothetical protein